ncbi:MAG TPA: S8 family serine peptidase [Glaciibacter sp.]|nr:S8 family serine peptidase [Glaciibacter sp.]
MNRKKRTSARCVLLLSLILTPGLLWAGEGKIRRSHAAVKNEYIVVLNDDIARDKVPGLANRLAKQHGGELKRVWQSALKGFFIRMNEGQARGLSHHPDVKYIEENAAIYFSAETVPTKVDPVCNPAVNTCAETDDNRLWHLDMLDQNSGVGTNEYSYCETGDGVYVYVIDSGVMRAHQEFGNDPDRVADGYDASGDPANLPAYNPCGGPGLTSQPPDGQIFPQLVRLNPSHGTAVGSLVNGKNVGVAREATIVPVKVTPCVRYGARKLSPSTPNTAYATGEIVFAHGNSNHTYHRVTSGGVTGSTATYPTNWHQDNSSNPVCCQTWGGVELEWVGPDALPTQGTIQMLIEGLDWIVGPNNPYPTSPAVVTLSTFKIAALDDGVTNTPSGSSHSLEDAIGNLLTYDDGHGITVIASANNQDADACDTTPGRMSRNNPNDPESSARPYKVITAGGTMLRNNPDENPNATGGTIGAEPPFVDTKPTLVARWRCHAGDSDTCSTNIYNNLAETPDPTDPADRDAYAAWTLGSNGGACVTLFAPAKNIPVANLSGFNTYRNPRANGQGASGTSWSAPIVAGMAARILQSNPTYSVDQLYTALMARTVDDLDETELDPPGVTGTPRAVLRLTPIVVQPLPAITAAATSGNTSITITASGPSGLQYELHEVDPDFDVAQYTKGAQSVFRLGPQSSNVFSVSSTHGKSYFARVISSCGTADTNITTISSLGTPAGLDATASGGTVTISWNTTANASGYKVERKIGTGAWTLAQTVTGTSVNDTPTVPAGVVLYRVRATQGSAVSDPSNNDVAYVSTFTDDPIVTTGPYTPIRAIHLVELRRAVNALRELNGDPAVYTGNAIVEASVQTLPVAHTDFTAVLGSMNTARAVFGLSNVNFTTPPVSSGPVNHVENVRAGVR